VAYDPTGAGSTVIRAGFGKFYQLSTIGVIATLLNSALIQPVITFDTGAGNAGNDPNLTGVPRAHASGCLSPILGNEPGLAGLSPACIAFVQGEAAKVAAGTFVNTEPTFDGNRQMPYTWGWSAGVKRQLMPDLAVSVDYVANVGRDQTTLLDINVGPSGPDGRITRLGANGFDPGGELVPLSNAAARATNFVRVMQYFTDSRFNTDFKSVELSLEKRMSNRWSGRVSYTLGYAHDVGAITDQLNPRLDYGRASSDNRHALSASANIDVFKGLGAGFVFTAYSGNPVNETTAQDRNGDGNNNERPREGIDDLVLPILSPIGADGIAIRNGIEGNNRILLDGRLQYVWDIQSYEAGLFLEIYNLLNHNNFGTATGARNSANFANRVTTTVGAPRQVQLGLRFTF
jgi:hypothetical protein